MMAVEVMFLQNEDDTIYTFTEVWDSLESAQKYASKRRLNIISYQEVPQA